MNFLPADFDKTKTIITLVAGRGDYPLLLARRILQQGIECNLISLHDETDEDVKDLFPPERAHAIHIGQLGKLLSILSRTKTSHVILAGQIRPMRLFSLKPDFRVLWLISRMKERNASTIFGALCEQIEKRNITVLDARCFMDDDIVQPAEKFPIKQSQVDFGIHIASEIARLNIGQSIVVRNGTVIAVEGFDGTNAMLKHCKDLNLKNTMFVKISKPGHDFRFDVPVFGMKTLELLHDANIKYAALESGKTIILDQENVLKRAKELGIKIFGY